MKSRSARPASRLPRVLLACTCALVCALAAVGCSKSEPPTGTVRYETEDAVVNMGMLLHGYTWDNATADVYSPNEMADDDVPDIEVPGTTEVSATFSENVRHAEVWRYVEDPEGESVECDYAKETVSFEVEPGWRYRVAATFEGGDAGYLFDVKGTGGSEDNMDEFVSTAMVVTFGDGEVLFVDQETGTPYYPTLPEGTPELTAGNIVRVSGNGIMLESYPAQYPGITDVEVIEEARGRREVRRAGGADLAAQGPVRAAAGLARVHDGAGRDVRHARNVRLHLDLRGGRLGADRDRGRAAPHPAGGGRASRRARGRPHRGHRDL